MISKGKWSIYQKLKNEQELLPYLLEMERLSLLVFGNALDKYKQIIVKPCYGRIGEGVFTVLELGNNVYEVCSETNKNELIAREQAFDYLVDQFVPNSEYFVQPKVTNASNDDYASIIIALQYQENQQNWQIKILSWSNLVDIAERLTHEYGSKLIDEMNRLSIIAIKHLVRYANCTDIYLLIALDNQNKPKIIDININIINDKWSQHIILSKSKGISSYLPETRMLSEATFLGMLHKHNRVIIKPCLGYWGKNMTQVRRHEDGLLELHTEKHKTTFPDTRKAFDYLVGYQLHKGMRNYIVQQMISLAKIDLSPFDLRVMLQRVKVTRKWSLTGLLARVACDGYFVTNVAKNILTIDSAVPISSVKNIIINDLVKEIEYFCKEAVVQLEKFFPNISLIGFDIGIDQGGRLWFFEANFKPDFSMFFRLDDKTMYNTIMGYKAKI